MRMPVRARLKCEQSAGTVSFPRGDPLAGRAYDRWRREEAAIHCRKPHTPPPMLEFTDPPSDLAAGPVEGSIAWTEGS